MMVNRLQRISAPSIKRPKGSPRLSIPSHLFYLLHSILLLPPA